MGVNKKRQNELKALGFLLQNDKEHFSVRILSKAGNYTTEEMKNINYLADKYGRGYVGVTTRLQLEIPWIKDNDVESFMCGGCVRACNLNAATAKEKGAEIFVGGRFGREMRLGDSLGRIFKEEEIIPVIDKIVEASKELGQTEERLSKTLDRIGAETFVNRVLEMVDGK